MSTPDRYPIELLNQPNQVRWTYFYRKLVAHPLLMEAHNTLKHAIRYSPKGRLILVFGPTGVGKTTLRQGIERALIEDLLPELAQDQGRIPVGSITAIAPERGNFDWMDFYQRALISLNEPLVDAKVVYEARLDKGRADPQQPVSEFMVGQAKSNLRTLRHALEQCLRYRHPAAFIIDDAQHLQTIASGRRLRDQMDTLKSLADQSDTVLVLIGTYELLNLTNLNDQLSRRSYHIRFARYRADCEQDVQSFKAVLQTFQRYLPLSEEPNLVSRWDYFYEHSAGCVGILKIWLCDTLAAALEHDQKTLTEKYLQQYAMSPDRLMNVVREIIEGEHKLEEHAGPGHPIRVALGLESEPVQAGKVNPPRKNGRVGERQPVRDPIGGAPHDH